MKTLVTALSRTDSKKRRFIIRVILPKASDFTLKIFKKKKIKYFYWYIAGLVLELRIVTFFVRSRF